MLNRRDLFTLRPKFEEPIAPEFYRYAGKIRVVVVLTLIAFNFATGLSPTYLGVDHDFYWKLMSVNIPALLLDAVLGVVVWRRNLSVDAMRRITYASLVLECGSTLATTWMSGSVSSHMIVIGMLVVLLYRAFYDFRTGALAMVLILAGQWTIVILETVGVLPIAPVMLEYVQLTPHDYRIGAMAMISIMLMVTFLVTNLVVARLNHKELAIRILRENLAAQEPGKQGRHTGRTLRDTYRLGNVIGTGGMGEVYRAVHLRTKRAVAVKLLHSQLLGDATLLKRFRREAEITGKLGSENIVEIVDIDQDDDQPFIVFELLEGESLGERLARLGYLPLAEVADIVDQASRGLQVAHDAGVVHRDLKPDNLFVARVGPREVVKILDFGVSKISDEATAITRELALLGTPSFMSPEQTVGAAESVSPAADIFALGAIAYTAISGARPFVASSIPALLRRIADEEPIEVTKLRPDAPADVHAVLSLAMAKRPGERYKRVEELARDLQSAIDGTLPAAVRDRAARIYRGTPTTQTATDAAVAIATGETLSADDEVGELDVTAAD